MNRDFFTLYERELQHLREMGGEFSRAFPKIAGRLALDEGICPDPYVERLLEGFAFLSARVQHKLESEFPQLSHSLLETYYPHYLAPIPSMVIVQFRGDDNSPELAEGLKLPRNTVLRSRLGADEVTRCEFRTAHDVVVRPVRILEAAYHTQDLGRLSLPAMEPYRSAKAAIRLRIKCPTEIGWSEFILPELNLHLAGEEGRSMRLYEQIMAHAMGVVVQPISRPVRNQSVLPRSVIQRQGFDNNQSLLPPTARSFEGYRLLQEYFSFPARFMFVLISDLLEPLSKIEGDTVDIIIPLKQVDLSLEEQVDKTAFELHSTPAINLFPKRCDRIHINERSHEFHVVADRTRPVDYEVYQVTSVTGFGTDLQSQGEFLPFYRAREFSQAGAGGKFFSSTRFPRVVPQVKRGPRSRYAGSEVYLSLVDSANAPYRADLAELGVTALCTNRDLPIVQLHLGQWFSNDQRDRDFDIEGGATVKAFALGTNSRPRESFARNQLAWRLISHLSLNYLSLINQDAETGASTLRDMLRLYVQIGDDQLYSSAADPLLRQVEAVRFISSKPIVRRIETPGPIAFARGLEIELVLDETGFENSGPFLLASVLEEFFARYVSVNSFTETVLRTPRRGEIMRWPHRIGKRPNL